MDKLKVYNTLTRKKEEFIPVKKQKVSMYVCGPTVYNYISIGNSRPIVVFNMVKNYLEYLRAIGLILYRILPILRIR
ncbi:MAG: hypothetical protein U5N58_14635 [Actinomycetota bacterium]|nr:hypothetical protein [Actinomycetota bacterium]